MPQFALILPAAGSSSRFGSDKLLARLNGRSVLDRTIDAFGSRADVAVIVLVGREAGQSSRILSVPGGACRAASVRNGVAAVPQAIEWVAVHDAARPLVSQELIDRTLAEAVRFGAAAPALAVHLTIKQADGPLPATVQRTVPRETLWAMQTPQVMRRLDLLEAFAACPIPLEQVTDDLQLLELAGRPVRLVDGDPGNIKITTPHDLELAETLLRRAQ